MIGLGSILKLAKSGIGADEIAEILAAAGITGDERKHYALVSYIAGSESRNPSLAVLQQGASYVVTGVTVALELQRD